jgi:methylase of polypeptide subunit release factors
MVFGGLRIRYDGRVLSPRSWTLIQSRWANELLESLPRGRVLELCCGAGQIGLAAVADTSRRVVCVDRDPVAASYTAANAARAGLVDRVEVREAPLDQAVGDGERFALVIADPPWVRSEETGRFPRDPVTAIDGGPDGLDVTRACLRTAARHLMPGGWLLLQVAGPAQAAEVARLVAADGPLVPVELRVEDDERAVQLLRG